jgi:hypothetical protein
MGWARSALTEVQILAWADAHHTRTGRWPNSDEADCGSLPDGDTWRRICVALWCGCRGLPRGGSLSRLLARQRGHRAHKYKPRLTTRQIFRWADDHHRHTGYWPTADSGPVGAAPHETWSAIDQALRNGHRGFPGGDTLSRLLHRHGRGSKRGPRPRDA